MKVNRYPFFHAKEDKNQKISRRTYNSKYDSSFAGDQALIVHTPTQAKSLLHNMK